MEDMLLYIRHAGVCLCQIDVLVCDNRLLLQQQNPNSTHFSSMINDEHTCPDGEINAHTTYQMFLSACESFNLLTRF
ncbi:hypothetical protein LDENG_00054590 [Lucifuga dentata]|nr:hypothetical protein LDENG_00054590 [Lucifuga dentata]